MAKPLFQDIVPPEKRSIKKIPIPERNRERQTPIPPREVVEEEQTPPPRSQPPKRKKIAPYFFTILTLIILGVLVYILLPKVTGAFITLTLKGQPVSINAQFNATTDPNGDLPYQTAEYQKDGKLAVEASGEENARVKASGMVRIFNNYSSAPQKLIANTRFQSPQGKIFRISDAITIPGKNGDTPGSVDVLVTADQPGQDYNVGLTDFTIPGFKGDPRFTKIFGRSKTAIEGGFIGTRKKVDPIQVAQARAEIRKELETNLVKQMQQSVPDDYVFLPGSYFITYSSLPDTPQDSTVVLTERATFEGIIFKRQNLAHMIAEKAGGSATSAGDIYNIDGLTVAPKISTSTTPWKNNPFVFMLNGTTTLVTGVDTDKLKEELAGKPRKSLNAVLEGYPGVARADVIIRPFWKQNFPNQQSEISIKIAPSPISP